MINGHKPLTEPDLAVRNVLLSGFPKHMQSHAASEYTTLEMAEKLVEHLRTAERVRDENIQRWMKAEKPTRLTGERLEAVAAADIHLQVHSGVDANRIRKQLRAAFPELGEG